MTDKEFDLRTISDTNAYISALVQTPDVVQDYFWLGGVVTFVFKSPYNHTYFTISDAEYSIKCMLSNRYEDKSEFISKGAMIDVYGVLSVYEKEAKVQLQVSDVRLAELDSSTLDTSVLEQLEAKGLFPRNKQDLPINPQHISLITSKSSEALRDFKYIYREQKGKATIELLDTFVQGEKAPRLIAQRIKEVNHDNHSDIIVLTRGGGRHDDLSTFNSFEIAEAICNSKIPIVTGIGHQRDETIADRVADHKTISPTDAAYKLALLTSQDANINVKVKSKQANIPHEENKFSLNLLVIGVVIIIGIVIVWLIFLQ